MKQLDSLAYFFSGFTVAALMLVFLILPHHINHSIWKDYRVLALPADTPLESVLQTIKKAGIRGAASELSLTERFSFLETHHYSGFLPFTDITHYTQWFTNQNKSVQYIYIPYKSFWKHIKLYVLLRRAHIPFFLEYTSSFSLIQLFGCLILFIYILFKVSKKIVFAALGFPFLLFSHAAHGSLPMTAALLALFSITYWLKALGKETNILSEQLKKRIQNNHFMFILPLAALFFAMLSGIMICILFLLAILLSAITTFLVYRFLQLYESTKDSENRHHFNILVMHPDSWKYFWNTKDTCKITVLTAVLLFLTAFMPLLFSFNRLPDRIKTLSIPTPSQTGKTPFTDDGFFKACLQHTETDLPDLTNYIEDRWYTAALPYMNINKPFTPVSKNAVITLSVFQQQEKGILKPTEQNLYTFNTDFILHTLKNESVAILPLEQMLLSQNGFLTAKHQNIQLYVLNKVVTWLLACTALFFPCILIIIAKRQ